MKAEYFNGVLLLVLIIASLMAPAILTISPLLVTSVSASPGPIVGKTTIGLYSVCTLIIEDSAENYEIIVRGKGTAYTVDMDYYPPYRFYVAGDRPPIMAAKRVGSGAVVVAGISSSTRNGWWNSSLNPDRHLDILLHCAFQWMVPGAENVLWYGETNVDYNVYNDAARCSDLVGSLKGFGYRMDNTINGAFTEITAGLLAGYNILVIPQFELPLDQSIPGGDPDLLPDVVVETIENFVRAGGGLLILDGGDVGGWNFCRVENKVLRALDMGVYLQSDTMSDPINKWDTERHYYTDVDTTTEIGSAYENATAALLPPYRVEVDILPGERGGMPGAMLTYYVNVKNVGLENDNYVLIAVDNENWSLNISPAELYVISGTTKTAMLKVRIPSGAPFGARDRITVTATSKENSEVSASGICTATVAPHPNTIIKADKVIISNPYRNYENWFKGNFHCHTTNSDGAHTPAEMMEVYRSKGYSFIAITDHNYLTDSEAFTDLPYFLGINGVEISPPAMTDMLAIDVENLIENWWYRSVTERVGDILAQGGIAIPAHPAYSAIPFPLENLRQAMDAGAWHMEIHAGDMVEAQVARKYWDTLLTEGRLVYGVMDDDAHSVSEAGRWGWNMVNAPELTKEAILQGLREGNLYCVQSFPLLTGTGPEIYSITVENENVISISSSGNHVLFISDNGVVLDGKDLIGGRASSSVIHGVSYIRMEVYGDNGAVSCTQPMMVSSVKFNLIAPQKIGLDVNLWLENGSKVVLKFYDYDNVYQAESVLMSFTPSVRILKSEDVSHPENKPIEKVVLQVTGENTENVVSTIASFTVSRDVSVDISPNSRTGLKTLNYTVTVMNMGNVLDNYALTVTDNAGWGPTVLPTSLAVPSGENRTATLSVTIPSSTPHTLDNIIVTATSQADNTVSDNASCLAISGFDLDLTAGWQIVSFPVTSANMTLANLFAGMTYTMKYYVAPYGPFKFAPPDQPVELGVGYLLKLDNNKTVTVIGVSPENYMMNLVAGWQIVGFPLTSENTTPEKLFAGVGYTMKYYVMPYGPFKFMPPDKPVELGVGYLLKLDNDKTITVPL